MSKLLSISLAFCWLWAVPSWAEPAALSGADITARVAQALAEAGQGGGIRISPHRSYPACRAELDVSPQGGSWQAVAVTCPGTADEAGWKRVFRVAESRAGSAQRRDTGQGQVTPALILRESLARGTVLAPEHLDYGAAPGLGYDGLVLHLDTAIGRRLKVNLSAGQALLARHIDHAWHVEEGAAVTLTVLRGGIRIDTTGYAHEDGQLGQRVPVRNARSGAVVYGVVTGQNKVEIGPNMLGGPVVNFCASGKNCGKRY
ncbi:MAG: flagellar basal body P-ring formation chaperone FlgA [Pseudomonadota bacterium]